MARTTVYNSITSADKLAKVSVQNMQLGEDWLEYMQSIDRSPQSIVAYRSDLNIFWVWNMEFNNNKFFSDEARNCKVSESCNKHMGLVTK